MPGALFFTWFLLRCLLWLAVVSSTQESVNQPLRLFFVEGNELLRYALRNKLSQLLLITVICPGGAIDAGGFFLDALKLVIRHLFHSTGCALAGDGCEVLAGGGVSRFGNLAAAAAVFVAGGRWWLGRFR